MNNLLQSLTDLFATEECSRTLTIWKCDTAFYALYFCVVYMALTCKACLKGNASDSHIASEISCCCRSLGCQIVALNSMLVKTFIWFHYKPTCSSRLRPTPNMYFSHLIWHFAFVQHKASRSLMTPLRACVINIDLGKKKKKKRWRAERGRRERC